MTITTSENEKFISIHIESKKEESLSWERLQEIKNSFYRSLDFIEVYPKYDEVVNKANVRHLIHIKEWNCPYLSDLEIESTINIHKIEEDGSIEK